jgi:hypothetical protein
LRRAVTPAAAFVTDFHLHDVIADLVANKKLPPHLIEENQVKKCSECKMPFPADSQPSLSKPFAEHVKQEHREKAT